MSDDDTIIANENADYCRSIIRERDMDTYLAALFLPADIRPFVYALFAFDAEIAYMPSLISEPMMGELRLQWWREVLTGGRAGEAANNPVAAGLLATINHFNLPVAGFDNYLKARIFDLYNDPMPDQATFEGYAGETRSFMLYQAATMLARKGGSLPEKLADCAGHAGVVLVLADILKSLPRHRSRRQCYVPQSLLDDAGLTLDHYFSADNMTVNTKLIEVVLDYMKRHICEFQRQSEQLPARIKPVFIALSLAKPYWERFSKAAGEAVVTAVDIPQWRKQIHLWRAARNGKY